MINLYIGIWLSKKAKFYKMLVKLLDFRIYKIILAPKLDDFQIGGRKNVRFYTSGDKIYQTVIDPNSDC